jgi:hypothetical protein
VPLKALLALGRAEAACYARPDIESKGTQMAEEEPILTDPPTQEVATHVRDYERFTVLLKWGAIISLALAFIVILIIA